MFGDARGRCAASSPKRIRSCQGFRACRAGGYARAFQQPLETQAMIYSTISFTVAPGKNFEANEYFHTVVRQVKKLTGSDVRILQQLAGPMGHYVLSSTFDSLAEWDQARAKIQNDTGFQKLVAEAGKEGLFVPGSVTSAIWQKQA